MHKCSLSDAVNVNAFFLSALTSEINLIISSAYKQPSEDTVGTLWSLKDRYDQQLSGCGV